MDIENYLNQLEELYFGNKNEYYLKKGSKKFGPRKWDQIVMKQFLFGKVDFNPFSLEEKLFGKTPFDKVSKKDAELIISKIKSSDDIFGNSVSALKFFLCAYLRPINFLLFELLKLTEFNVDECFMIIEEEGSFSGEQLLKICKGSCSVKVCRTAFAEKRMTNRQLTELQRYFRQHGVPIRIPINEQTGH